MIDERLQQQLAFIVEIERLKRILRRTSLVGGDRRENSAEHSWHIAVAAMVLAEYTNAPIDLYHVLKMLLVHDIVEIDAGDTFAFDAVGMADKEAREETAADRLFGLLPDDQSHELRGLWEEFDARSTPEAKFANLADRLLPVLQNARNNGGTWAQARLDRTAVERRLEVIDDGSATIWAYVQSVLDEAVAQGMIRPPDTQNG